MDSYNAGVQAYKFTGKELIPMHGLNWQDYGARWLDNVRMQWPNVDPLCEKYYPMSPYAYCADNSMRLIDPNGLAWFYYSSDGKTDPTWIWRDKNQYHTGVKDSKGNEIVLHSQEAVVTADGSTDEKVGKNGNMVSPDSKLANFTVYGPNGKNDIKHYRGLAMTSDFKEYGVIDNGEYEVDWRDAGKSKAPFSHWAVNNTDPVNCLFGENRSSDGYGYSETQKDGVYCHSTLSNNGRVGRRTFTGCILIVPSGHGENGWDEFCTQLRGVSNFSI